MVRRTSAEAYHKIKEEGLLSKRKWEVYDMIYEHEPISQNDTIRKARSRYPNANQTSFNARFSELKKLGVIEEVGETKDIVSGQKCYLWATTGNLPKKLQPVDRRTQKQKMQEELEWWKQLLRQVYAKFPGTRGFIEWQIETHAGSDTAEGQDDQGS